MKAATPRPREAACKRSISIHAAREGGDTEGLLLNLILIISIHAAREGGDADFGQHIKHVAYFNPRRP